MSKEHPTPLRKDFWLVIQENEGLVTESFTHQKQAIARAKQLARKHPYLRVEVARYFIAPNSWKLIGAPCEEK